MNNTLTTRQKYIDYLKIIGLIGLTIAHVQAPNIVMQIRSFDVPLMVFASGLLAAGSFERSGGGIVQYIKKRIIRLLIPTWVFLSFYFIVCYLTRRGVGLKMMVESYLLKGGIGYVWIIWVYIMCACMIPFFLKVHINGKFGLSLLILLYICYELGCYFDFGTNIYPLYATIYLGIPYGLLTIFGMKYYELSARCKMIICGLGALIYAALAVKFSYGGGYVLTSIYKYPPRIYYLSYAIAVIIPLTEVLRKSEAILKEPKLLKFIASSTLWIYLWHILWLRVVGFVIAAENWILNYVLVISFSVMTTWVQNKIVGWLESKGVSNCMLSVFKG